MSIYKNGQKVLGSFNDVTGFVEESDIVTTLDNTATDEQIPSALATYTELNKKIDKSSITTTIDYSSTDNQVPSAKSIYYNCIEGISLDQTAINTYGTEILKYPLGIWRINGNSLASNFTDLPVQTSGRIEITSIDANANKTPWNSAYSYRIYNFETYTGGNYIRKITSSTTAGKISNDSGWQRVCTTSVTDIPVTTISMSSTYTSNANCKYQVVNGICYIDFMQGTYNLTSNVNGVILASGLPIPRTGQACVTYVPWASADASKQVIIFVNGVGQLILHAPVSANSNSMFCSFSYPVAES